MTQCHEDESEAAVLAALGPLELGQGPVFTFPLTEEAQDERAPLHVQTHTIYSTHTCAVTDLRCVKRPVAPWTESQLKFNRRACVCTFR